MQGFPSKLTVQEMIFDPKAMQDETNFYNQRYGKPDELTSQVIYMLGDYGNQFPISMSLTSNLLGKSKKSVMNDIQYTYPVIGRQFKASRVAADCIAGSAINAGTLVGLGGGRFKIRFTDNMIKRQYIIQSGRGVQVRVIQDPIPVDGQWEYTVEMASGSMADYCPDSELYAGAAWIQLFAPVPESESRGTESASVAPGKVKNQMTHIRKSMQWAGNAANKVMTFSVKPSDNKSPETNLWMDYFMYQFEWAWATECEHMYWYSRYNRQDNGFVELKDALTGKPVSIGSGILEQIGNYSTYTRLSYDFLTNKIGTALFGQSDTADMTITLYTGKGGMREIDRALKSKALGALGLVPNYADNNEKFIKGSGWDMELGGFFNGFAHIDGYTIKVKHNPVFDLGYVAEAQREAGIVHPETGYPLESYRMVFIDDATYQGQPNLQYVTLKGREEMMHGYVKGLTTVPKTILQMFGGSNGGEIQADVDSGSYHRMKVGGVQLLRSNKCFHLEMVL